MEANDTACIIVNFNDWRRTLELTKTIVEYPSIKYVIVVDNCSSDESAKILREYTHPKYIFIFSSKNGGYGCGNNIGIKKAKMLGAKYVVISNPDVVFDNSCITKLIKTMQSNPNCAIAGAKETTHYKTAWRFTSPFFQILRNEFVLLKLTEPVRNYPAKYFKGEKEVKVDIIPGCFFITDVELFTKYGMYDENCFLYYEEEILYHKFKKASYIFLINTSAEYKHLHKESTLPASVLRTKTNMLNGTKYYLKNYCGYKSVKMFLANLFMKATYAETCVRMVWLAARNKTEKKP